MDYSKLNKDIALVFDFDGTMCQIFKNFDLGNVVFQLKEKMHEHNIEFSLEKDSFDIFDEIIKETEEGSVKRVRAFREANDILTTAELSAVKSGELVHGVDVVIPQLLESGISIGISTNNSAQCALDFIKQYLPDKLIPTVGRIGDMPELMKPHPYSILKVLNKMNIDAVNTIFIGDSLRDYYGALNAGCKFIGMAPTDRKRKRLLGAISESEIVADYYELLKLLEPIILTSK